MNDLRTAAQQALEALEWHLARGAYGADIEGVTCALRAALSEHFCDTHCTWADHAPGCVRAEPVQEPVAWAVYDIKHGGSKTLHWPEQHSPNGDPEQFKAVPLYSAPPQRKPLSLTDLQEALVYTNLVDRDAIDDPDNYDEGSSLAQIDALHRIIGGNDESA